jgi:uncharacterized protein
MSRAIVASRDGVIGLNSTAGAAPDVSGVAGFSVGTHPLPPGVPRALVRPLPSPELAGMHVSELHIHPVKGAAGIAVDAVELDGFGPRHDRRWMIVAADGEFVTQRNHPTLALLQTALEPDALVLRSRGAGEVRLALEPPEGAREETVRVWDDDVAATDCGDAAAAFVSAHLDVPARLVYMPATTLRQADLDYARPGDRVSFADGFPLLLITQQSLDELNRRLPEPIPMLRFRPNVVVDGAARPHEEDEWRTILLGTVSCDVVKPCARCAVTTVDQSTGAGGPEPLRTLAEYRRWKGKVWFGQNVLHRGTGVLRVGDAVEVVGIGEPRPPIARQRPSSARGSTPSSLPR